MLFTGALKGVLRKGGAFKSEIQQLQWYKYSGAINEQIEDAALDDHAGLSVSENTA